MRPITFCFPCLFFIDSTDQRIKFNSDLLSKIKIPLSLWILFFANRWIIVSSFLLVYIFLGYIGIRLIFALPEMILRDRPFRAAIREAGH